MNRGAIPVLLIVVLGLCPHPARGQLLDTIVARVDSAVVTWSQVVQELELQRISGTAVDDHTPDSTRDALVQRLLLVSEARKLRLAVGIDEVREELVALMRAAGAERFLQQTSRLGLGRERLEERAAQQLLARRYEELKREMAFVPESDVRDALRGREGTPPGREQAELRDAVRARLAEAKYREDLERWLQRQMVEGRVVLLPLPVDTEN